MKKMLFSAIAMVAFTGSINASVFLPISPALIKTFRECAASSIAVNNALIEKGLSESVAKEISDSTYLGCVIGKYSSEGKLKKD